MIRWLIKFSSQFLALSPFSLSHSLQWVPNPGLGARSCAHCNPSLAQTEFPICQGASKAPSVTPDLPIVLSLLVSVAPAGFVSRFPGRWGQPVQRLGGDLRGREGELHLRFRLGKNFWCTAEFLNTVGLDALEPENVPCST